MRRWVIAFAASLAAAQAGAQGSWSLLPDGHPEWPQFVDKAVADVSTADGACLVHVKAWLFESATTIQEIALRPRPGGEINIEVATHLVQEGRPGMDMDIAIPVGKQVRRITFGRAAALLWEREHSRCPHPD